MTIAGAPTDSATPVLDTRTGDTVAGLAEGITDVYAEVFSSAPWHEPPDAAARFRARLAGDADRPGFRAVVAHRDGDVLGFATGWRTPSVLPATRAYPHVVAALGVDRAARLLAGGFEVDELAVRPSARRDGLGRRLSTAITEAAPQGRAWLLTARHAADTVAFYRRAGWHEVPPLPGAPHAVTVFLAPHHPLAPDLRPTGF